MDGIYSGLRGTDDRLCVLVVIGVNAKGEKHFLAIEDGVRESTQSPLSASFPAEKSLPVNGTRGTSGLKARGLTAPKAFRFIFESQFAASPFGRTRFVIRDVSN